MEIERSVLLPYSTPDIFDLIETAENYPEFLPWCTAVTLLERSDDWVAARLEFNYRNLRFGFQTRNPKQRPDWLLVRMVDGPFKRFQGAWALKPLGLLGCRVSFTLSFELADGVFDGLAAPVFDRVTRQMVDAFVQRAHATLTMLDPAQEAPRAPAQTGGESSASPGAA